MAEKKYKTVDEILLSAKQSVNRFIVDMENDEKMEGFESATDIENRMKGETERTHIKKKAFIENIKGDLGPKIKEDPMKVKIVEKTKSEKIKGFFNNLFTKF